MSDNINKVIKFVALYVVQVGALWGLLEAYTYFRGDMLKNFLSSFWIVIYIIPLFTSGYVLWYSEQKEKIGQESISTEGDYSPGKVGSNYKVNTRGIPDPTLPNEVHREGDPDQPTIQSERNIKTKGHFSPGEVSGDYTVDG